MIEQQRQKFGKAKISTHNGQSLLNKATGFIAAYDFTLNPYRGCEYGCSYCYAAAFSPNSQMGEDWGNWVIIKQNAVELLKQELKRWQKKHPDTPPSIYMSSVTDPYQPIEAKEKLTRQLLEVMIDYQPTLVIQTRSPMIVRDVDLLKQLERLRVNLSIPTGSDRVRKDFEGRSPSIKARLQAIARLKYSIPCNESHDARFSITLTPLLPTFPEEEANFISKLAVVDRLVIQAFHSQNQKSLYVYFMRYFLENVYSTYLAWFLIYQQGLLPKQINILDLAAGPGTVAYGLALLLRSSRKLLEVPDLHLSYYSLEKQNQFQDRGLQFWRYYLEQQPLPTNAYFRFDTTDFFTYSPEDRKVPPQFFDFIVVSHCTFANPERRYEAHQTFADIFRHSLKDSGHVLLIVQNKKLFKIYNNNTFSREDLALEEKCVLQLVEEMGLSLVWYKYLTSTPLRTAMKGSEFGKFARENLPVQQFIAPLNRQYLNFKYDSSYGLDDYVILARLK